MNARATVGTTVLAAVAILGAAAPAAAQTGWLPFLGCWTPDGAPEGEAAVCVRPGADQGSVELLRVEEGQITAREVVWADGARHETVREECTGWEEGSFSQDGRRVFLRSEHTCAEGGTQRGAGVMALVDEDVWVDVRSLDIAGEPTAWVQRYVRDHGDANEVAGVGDMLGRRAMAIRAARIAASDELDLEDVREAVNRLPAAAVEAWLAVTGDPFDLDAETLVALSEAGVPDRVVDVLVAVSYPHRFALADGQAELQEGRARSEGTMRAGYRPGWGGPFWWSDFYYGRRGYGYGYSPYAYGYGPGYYGYGYGYGYGYRPTVIVVEPRRDTGPRGRVYNGRGYTRGGAASQGGGYTPPRSSTGSSSASGSRGSSASGSSGTKASTGRKAKRRGGGDAGAGL